MAYLPDSQRPVKAALDYTSMTLMLKEMLLYGGSAVIALWGIAHIVIPTRNVIEGFGPLSRENERILRMEWIMEGLTLGFIGVLVSCMTIARGAEDPGSIVVYRVSGLMLIAMAGVSLFTGARTSIVPMKLCPLIFTLAATLFWLTTVL